MLLPFTQPAPQSPTTCGLLKWNQRTMFPNFTYEYLVGVDIVPDNLTSTGETAWAVGYGAEITPTNVYTGIARYWDGSDWLDRSPTPAVSGYNYVLRAVKAFKEADVWVVGHKYPASLASTYYPPVSLPNATLPGNPPTYGQSAVFLHWDGSGWTEYNLPSGVDPGYTMAAVDGAASDDVWAVGSSYDYINEYEKTLAAHWNGITWVEEHTVDPSLGNNRFLGVAAYSSNDVWAVGAWSEGAQGQSLVEHWDGSDWERVESPNPGGPYRHDHLYGVTVSSESVWVVGEYQDPYDPSYRFHSLAMRLTRSTAAWSLQNPPDIGSGDNALTSIGALGEDNFWVAGYANNGSIDRTLVHHWTGSWSTDISDSPGADSRLLGVQVAVSNDGTATIHAWAVGYSDNNGASSKTSPLTERYELGCIPDPPSPCAEVEWTDLQGVAASGNTISKNLSAGYSWSAGAVSTQTIAAGTGYVEVSADSTNGFRMFGLGSSETGPTYQDIDFALELQDGGGTRIYESGTLIVDQPTTYTKDDLLRVSYEYDPSLGQHVVRWYKNQAAFYTELAPAISYPLYLDSSIYTPGASLDKAYICQPVELPQLMLSPISAGPNVVSTTQTLTAQFVDRYGAPLVGKAVTFVVTGTHTTSGSATTDGAGRARFTYTGTSQGLDQVLARASDGYTQVTSALSTVGWITPVVPISTTSVNARFFPHYPPDASQSQTDPIFDAQPGDPISHTQSFPTIYFNPSSALFPAPTPTPHPVDENSRPIIDVTTSITGAFTGLIPAQGAGVEVGHTPGLRSFNAVFTGAFVVSATGVISLHVHSHNGFILGIGNGATRVGGSGSYSPPITPGLTTRFEQLPVVGQHWGAFDQGHYVTIVNFPAPGTYPYELDYFIAKCCGNTLYLNLASGLSGNGTIIPGAGALTINPWQAVTKQVGSPATFMITATDGSGLAVANRPIALLISGANSQQVLGQTDGNGVATLTYTGTNQGDDTVEAVAWVSGMPTYSAAVTVHWGPSGGGGVQQYLVPGWIGGPRHHSLISDTVPITLSAALTPSFTLRPGAVVDYWPISNPGNVTQLTTTSAPISPGGQITTFDTTTLANGSYIIHLQGSYSNGTITDTSHSAILVTVVGEYKPGRVTYSLTDLIVPVTGLPITIGRTYDSLLRNKVGDFGNGWNLSVGTPQLEENAAHDVTLTMQDGRRVTFLFTPRSGGGVFGFLHIPEYTPEPGVYGRLTTNGCGLVVVAGGQWYCFPGGPYAPTLFTYTDPYGREYVISKPPNQASRLQAIRDLNGNVLTFSATGIRSSAGGLNVPFARDIDGRITTITDTMGNVYRYEYHSTTEDLQYVRLPGVTNPITYTYTNHLLDSAYDPRGNRAVRTTYYTNGRLETITDARNNTITYTYDLNDKITTITNPDGGQSRTRYNAYGLVLSQTNPLGHTDLYSYDTRRNLIAWTDPLNHTTSYSYTTQGLLQAVTDPLTRTSTLTYNQFGGPTRLVDPLNNRISVFYDANQVLPIRVEDVLGTLGGYTFDSHGSPLTRSDGNGKTTRFRYDPYGNVISETNPLLQTTTYTYDNLGRKRTSIDPLNHTTSYKYDELGNLLIITNTLNYTTSYQYDPNGNQTARIDALERRANYEYDAANQLQKITYPDNTIVLYTYDWRGQPLTTTNQLNQTTKYEYDLAGQVLTVTHALGTVDASAESYRYYADGRKQYDKDGRGNATTYSYYADGKLSQVSDPLAHVMTYTYDLTGRLQQVLDAGNHPTGYVYNPRGQLLTKIFTDTVTNLTSTISQDYDGAGNMRHLTDQANKTTTYTYDDAGQLRAVQNPLLETTSYDYTALGALHLITDAENHTTEFEYDALNRVITKTWAIPSYYETFTYDEVGNLHEHRLADGNVNVFDYDARDRLQKETYFDHREVTYDYYDDGARRIVTDTTYGRTDYAYDNQGRLALITLPGSLGTLEYRYDTADNRVAMTTTAGSTVNPVSYGYDAANRLTSLDGLGATAVYTYNNVNLLTGRGLYNGVVSSYGYDGLNRLTNVTHSKNGALAAYTYTLGPAGNRTRVDELGNLSTTWDYDAAYRLLKETHLVSSSPTLTTTYQHDHVGNRKVLTVTTGSLVRTDYSYNALDQITQTVSGGITTPYYYNDGRGNLTDIGSTLHYDYDAADRMFAATVGVNTIGYSYDADGRRVRQDNQGVITNYLWDEASPYGDVVLETDGSSTLAGYLLGGTDLVAEWVGRPYYYLADGQGSIRAMTDSPAGNVSDTYNYDAFGNLLSSSGSTTNPYQYTGQYFDGFTGLYNLRARYYNPGDGRFLSRDTAEFNRKNPVELNRYSYANNNPVNSFDPTGYNAINEYKPLLSVGGGVTRFPWWATKYGRYVENLVYLLIVLLGGSIVADSVGLLRGTPPGAADMGSSAAPGPQPESQPQPRSGPKPTPTPQLPILEIPRSRLPEIADHVADAQATGHPNLLTYANPIVQVRNRAAACGNFIRTRPNGSCDEYPFATTYEGGAGSSTREVPAHEQRLQGGLINGFRARNRIVDGDRFLVVVVP